MNSCCVVKVKVRFLARIRMKRRRKKSRKLYGSRYHGYGQVGEHKGSGQKGGKGNAGGKDHIKIKLLKEGHIFGSRGFTDKGPKTIYTPINIGELIELIKDGKVKHEKEGEFIVIKMDQLPYNKILGRGKVDLKLKLIVSKETVISKKAADKIQSIGGIIETVS